MNIMKDKNWLIAIKKGKGKLLLFCGSGEQIIPICGLERVILCGIQKELWLVINYSYLMVKCQVSHSKLQTEANLGLRK